MGGRIYAGRSGKSDRQKYSVPGAGPIQISEGTTLIPYTELWYVDCNMLSERLCNAVLKSRLIKKHEVNGIDHK